MIYVLFMCLLLLAYIIYIVAERDILSPSLIACGVFIICVFIAILYSKKWNLNLSIITALVIITALISMFLGEVSVRQTIKIKQPNFVLTNDVLLNNKKNIEIPTYQIVLVSIFMSIVVFLYFKEVYRISLVGGNPGGYQLMLKYARAAKLQKLAGATENHLLSHFRTLCNALAYFFMYIFLYNCIFSKFKKKYLQYFIPILIYSIQCVLTGGRTSFIYLVATGLMSGLILWKKKNYWSSKNDIKIIQIGALCMAALLIVFFLLGVFTGKTKIYNLWTTIGMYVGSPLAALDAYLKLPPKKTGYFGKETLSGIYAMLRAIGFKLPNFYLPLENIHLTTGSTNIYTSLRRYIQDYSYLGMLFIEFILGVIYTRALLRIKQDKKIGVSILIYSALIYPIIESAVEERFLNNILSLSTFYQVFYILIVYWIFIKRNIHFDKK